jgi:alkylation response protein AidB-like acyl-CoA dehydrogenase
MTTHVIAPVDLPAILAPTIAAALDEADSQAEIPQRLHSQLRDAGAFRMLTPREYGGSETPLTELLEVYERFGHIDASTGLLVWNANFGFIAALLSEAGAQRIWPSGTEPTLANSGVPGVAARTAGGYRLSGRMPIVTGIGFADWFIAVGVVTENGEPCITAAGGSDVRLFAVQRGQFTIEHTWNVTGMRGSGSNDVVVADAFIPDDLVAALDPPALIDRPLYRGFIPTLVFPGATAVVLGVARRAIEETVTLAPNKTMLSGGTLADSPRAQHIIAKSEAAVAAARLLLLSAADSLQRSAESNTTVSLQQRADLRAAMTHAAQVSRDALVAMYELASSTALYRTNPIERVFRDGMAALQHANHSAQFLEAAGRVRFGIEPGMPLF